MPSLTPFLIRGKPAFGITESSFEEWSAKYHVAAAIPCGPCPQLRPIASTAMGSSAASTVAMSLPASICPESVIVTEAITGTVCRRRREDVMNRRQRGLHLQQVLAGLDNQHVHAAGQQADRI